MDITRDNIPAIFVQLVIRGRHNIKYFCTRGNERCYDPLRILGESMKTTKKYSTARQFLACFLLLGALGACSMDLPRSTKTSQPHPRDQTDESDPAANSSPRRVSYTELDRVSATSMRATTLCDLVKGLAGPSGVYRVTKLEGVAEVYGNGTPNPHTYISLQHVSTWSKNAPKSVVARIPGGPLPTDGVQSWLVGMKLGEIVGLHLYKYPGNKGFYGIHPLGVWRQREGGAGVTNGQLFTKSAKTFAEIGVMVAKINAQSKGCAISVAPDSSTASTKNSGSANQSNKKGTSTSAQTQQKETK